MQDINGFYEVQLLFYRASNQLIAMHAMIEIVCLYVQLGNFISGILTALPAFLSATCRIRGNPECNKF